MKAGIMGGELSQAWPLLDLAGRKPKLSGGGTKKLGSTEAYEISLVPRGGSDMEIKVYFDTQTFQHVRTEYSLVVRPSVGLTVDSNKSQQPSRYKMIEEFGDFKKEGDLTLPHTYKITLEMDRSGNIGVSTPNAAAVFSFRGNWDMTLDQFGFNQAIPPETFSPPNAQ
jgi:outer membrane lipoprotein-sorting protein